MPESQSDRENERIERTTAVAATGVCAHRPKDSEPAGGMRADSVRRHSCIRRTCMRFLKAFGIIVAVAASACSGSGMSSPISPSATTTMSGAWLGNASDSSGSMMGAGLTSAMMRNTTWTLTQTGNMFSGTMHFAGYVGGPATVSGTMNGRSGTFTMTMPSGSMMMGTCTATASGTLDMDDVMAQLHGTYSGLNSCTGPFDQGAVSMHR